MVHMNLFLRHTRAQFCWLFADKSNQFVYRRNLPMKLPTFAKLWWIGIILPMITSITSKLWKLFWISSFVISLKGKSVPDHWVHQISELPRELPLNQISTQLHNIFSTQFVIFYAIFKKNWLKIDYTAC